MAGGAPLLIVLVRQLWRERGPALFRALLVPIVAVTTFTVVTAGLIAIAHGDRGQSGSGVLHAVFVVWVGLAIVVAAACALGAHAALGAADLHVRELRPAVIGAAIAAQAMTALTVAVALYTVALVIDAPAVAALSDGPLPTSATALLLYLVGPMVGFAIVAQITTARGWRALRAGRPSA